MNENLNQGPNKSQNQNLNQKPVESSNNNENENPKKKLGPIILITVLIVLGLIAIFAFSSNKTNQEVIKLMPTDIDAPINNTADDNNLNEPLVPVGETVICTMDAMECPNGGFVGRVAPDCEFAACPIIDVDSIGQTEELIPVEQLEPAQETIFCAMDVRECADGTFVGRVAPDCDFAECPIIAE